MHEVLQVFNCVDQPCGISAEVSFLADSEPHQKESISDAKPTLHLST